MTTNFYESEDGAWEQVFDAWDHGITCSMPHVDNDTGHIAVVVDHYN